MEDQCKLVSSSFAFIIQFLLGAMSFSTLLIKRFYYENPKRDKQVWIYDTGKQVISAVTAHIINIIIAIKISGNNQCEWYFINFFMDTFLGTVITFGLVRLVNKIAIKKELMLIYMGHYGQGLFHGTVSSNGKKMFLIQTAIWTGIVVFGKVFIVLAILYPCRHQFESFGKIMLHPVSSSPNLELTIVMIVFPLILNTIQVLLYDYLLKKNIKSNTVIDMSEEYAEL